MTKQIVHINDFEGLGKDTVKLEFDSKEDIYKFFKNFPKESQPVFDTKSLTYKSNIQGFEKLDLTRNLRKKIAKAFVPGSALLIDTIDKKLKENNLGASEILEQNKYYHESSNFRPSYKILANYSHLISPAENRLLGFKEGDLNDTIRIIKEIVAKYNYQVSKLAKHLNADTYIQTMFNIWHFLTTNIPFKIEDDEELRTPARSFHIDRFLGIDCDDFSIFTACLLTQLGYDYEFHVVAFHNRQNFGHIYVVCNNIVIDGVMKKFNAHPDNITKKMIIPMKIRTLGALSVDSTDPKKNAIAEQYNKLEYFLKTTKNLEQRENILSELRKLETVLMLSGSSIQNDIVNVLDLVDYVDNDFDFFINDSEISGLVDEYLTEVENLQGLGDVNELGKIRDAFKNLKNKIKENKVERKENKVERKEDRIEKKVERKEDRKEKKIERKEDKKERKEERKNMTVTEKVKNVAFAVPRVSFLLLLKVNFLKLASKMYFGYFTEAEAIQYKLDLTEYRKLVDVKNQFEKKFLTYGGTIAALKDAVFNGRGKEKALKDLAENDVDTTALKGLGVEPATTTVAVTAAVGTSSGLWSFLKKLFDKVDFKKLVTNAVELAPEIVDNVINKNTDEEIFDNNVNNDLPDDSTTEGFDFKKYWWVGLIGIALALSGKKTKKGK